MRTPSHRRCSVLLAALALLVSAPGSARAAEAERSTQGAANSRLIPVWAFVNGDAPLARGRVRIMAGGKSVRQVNGRIWKRTNAEGVAVLRMRRVPRRFTVVVRRGNAAGRRVPGSQYRIVTNYRRTRVVEVNPLTTLVTRLRRQRPALHNRRAVGEVKRYFRVPRWSDLGQNLRDMGDEWFDSRLYLRNARRYGSINRLNRVVARKILSGKAPRAHPAALSRTASASQVGGWLRMKAGELVGAAFEYLGKATLEIVGQSAVGGALGGLLQLAQSAGLISLPKSDMDQVREQLDAIGAQLTQLKGKIDNLTSRVERNNASQLLHQSDPVLARIDHARADLALLASMGQTDPTRKNFAGVIDGYIANNLQDAPELLNAQLNPGLSIGDNVIKATSRALAATDRFYDERDSAKVQQVYDYFAMYQVQLAVLLTNYWNAHPGTYSENTIKASIARIEASVTKTQTESVKPAVPAGTFFDLRTPRFMWGTDNRTVNALTVEQEGLRTSASIGMFGFRNWQMPAHGDLGNLVDGATDNPRAWLQDQVEVPLKHQLLWTSDMFQPSPVWRSGQGIDVTIFDLQTGRREGYFYDRQDPKCPGTTSGSCDWKYSPDVQVFLRSKAGGLMLLRYLAPGESYWW
jgi:hypothetical protein